MHKATAKFAGAFILLFAVSFAWNAGATTLTILDRSDDFS